MRTTVTAVLLAVYGFVLSCLTLSPHVSKRQPTESCLRLVPGRNIVAYLDEGGWPMVVNVLGNLAAFVPLGILWPLLHRGRTNVWRVTALSASVSFLIESMQFASRRRIADVDDIILNTLGGLLGYGAYRALTWAWNRVAKPGAQSHSSGTGSGG